MPESTHSHGHIPAYLPGYGSLCIASSTMPIRRRAGPGLALALAGVRLCAAMLLCGPSAAVLAQDAERDRWLWLETDIAQRNKDKRAQDAIEQPFLRAAGQEVLVIKGRRLGVDRRDARQVQTAMFLAINHRQWQDLARFLGIYRDLSEREPHVQRFAEAALAGSEGNIAEAEAAYREALALRPDFSRARIDLARLLFEDRRNGESEQEFRNVLADPRLPENVRITLRDGFIRAIELRRSWSGSVAFGFKHNDNLNQSTASNECLSYDEEGAGLCMRVRNIPAPVAGRGLSYEASASRRYDLVGHHGLAVRGLVYGDSYANHSDFNEMTLSLHAGYSYQDARHTLLLAPLFEFNLYGKRKMYDASGLRADWTAVVSKAFSFNVQAEHKRFHYRDGFSTNNDGVLNGIYATAYRSLPAGFTLIGGLEWGRKHNDLAMYRYTQRGVRLGFYRPFGQDFTASVMAVLRDRKHDGYSPLLQGTRNDKTQMYITTLRAPGWKWRGLSPRLSWRHTRTRSSIDWLYAYNKNEVSLMLEASF